MSTETPDRAVNVAKLMARMNPKGLSLGGTGGGGPSLTTMDDIRGALGAAGGSPRARLAMLVLCVRNWPAALEGPSRMVEGREVASENDAMRRLVSMVRRMLQEGAEALPKVSLDLTSKLRARVVGHEFLEAWARLVLHEYRHPNHCPSCTSWGRLGQLPMPVHEFGKVVAVEWTTCEECTGQGVTSWAVRRRAKALRIGEHPFRAHLQATHDKALSELRQLESKAARRVARQLR